MTTSVLNEALIKNTSVIVAYHPTIFKPLQSFTLSNSLHASLLKCAASGISVYSPHTALDSIWGGVNDWLAEGVIKAKEDGQVHALVREKVNTTTGISEGAEGRLVTLKEPISMDVLEKRIKSHLKLAQSLFIQSLGPNLNYPLFIVQVGYPIRSTTLVRSIAICAGSGGSMLVDRDADVYLTGEMSHVRTTIHLSFTVCLFNSDYSTKSWPPLLRADTLFYVSVLILSLSFAIISIEPSQVVIRIQNEGTCLFLRRSSTRNLSQNALRKKVWKM